MTPDPPNESSPWDQVFFDTPYAPEAIRAKHAAVAQEIMAMDPRPTKILDLGCGPGWFESELRAQGYLGEYTGVDFSRFGIRMARLNCPLDRPTVFTHADVRTYEPGSSLEGALVMSIDLACEPYATRTLVR